MQKIFRCKDCQRGMRIVGSTGLGKEVERKAGAAPPPEPAILTATDREVVDLFVARLRRQIAAEAAEAAAAPDGAAKQTG